jgi:sarcosine oxidase, subunit alpha
MNDAGASLPPRRCIVDGEQVELRDGDTIALAVLRAGQHPARGGTLCLAGDCPNCVAEVDGVPFVRTCQTLARPGAVVRRHPAVGGPSMLQPTRSIEVDVSRSEADLVVIGAGRSGSAAAAAARAAGRNVVVLDAGAGDEVVCIDAGPTVIVRRVNGMLHLHAHEVVIATGAAEVQPVCPGNHLSGVYTARAIELAHRAGVELGKVVALGEPPVGVPCEAYDGRLVRLEGDDRVRAAVISTSDGSEMSVACDTVSAGLGSAPRDVLARMAPKVAVSVIGSAAAAHALPPAPVEGVVCPCSKVTVEDLDGVWARGFHELELVKRASLCGTGTCQGGVCLPHLRAFVAARSGSVPEPFTARPAARQLTLAEAAGGFHLDPVRRTPLHDEHLHLGARLDRFGGWWRPWNYGDHVAEYWAVREAVSIGDVSTLGKMIVSGPDVVELIERLYPTTLGDLQPGRSRYVLLLNERGHVIDDGMVCREGEQRFVLTFTSGGASNAEMWVRDWIETWRLRVHVLDRTASLGAINVTGPLAADLLRRAGVEEVPRFLQHRHLEVAGVPCHVMRLSFTGESSFELHHSIDRSVELWQTLLTEGHDLGIKPHGLQALFGLRLEKGHVIVGQDTELDTSPRRIGMDWAVKMAKPDFVGRSALARTSTLPDDRRLVGLTMAGVAPLEGSVIRTAGEVVGHVTSSFTSPLLGAAVMLGWVKRSPVPAVVEIDERPATVSSRPFYDLEGRRARA